MTNWWMSVTGPGATFLAGVLLGALLWHWRMSIKLRNETHQHNNPAPLLWDIHSVLNAMNKLALTAERGRPIEPSLVYLLSDYLLHSALIQREEGWADRNALESWLLAHVRVVADHRGQITLPAVKVQMSDGIRRVHANQLLRQLLWFLQKAPSVTRICIHVTGPSKAVSHKVKARIEMEGDRLEAVDLSKSPADEALTGAWRMESGVSNCELQVAYEVGTA